MQAVDNAAKYVAQGGAEVMKCEGNKHHAKYIEAIVKAGIPVQGHIGITPMRMPQLGGFVAQGKTAERAKELIDDAWAMVDAGCFSIMCEVTTSEVCEYLAETLPVPVISLGAGNRAHGVHIIGSDLFHLYEKHVPRHSKIYVDLVPILEKGLSDYRDEVRGRDLPRQGAHRLHEGRRARAVPRAGGVEEEVTAAAATALAAADLEVLGQARFFSGLGPGQRARVAGRASVERYPAGYAHLLARRPGRRLLRARRRHGPLHARARQARHLGGRDHPARRGVRLGRRWSRRHARRIATAYCLTPCDVIALSGAGLVALMEGDHAPRLSR